MYTSDGSTTSSDDSIWTVEKNAERQKCRQRRRQSCGAVPQQAWRHANILIGERSNASKKLTRSCSSSGNVGGGSVWSDATSDIFYIGDHMRKRTPQVDIGLVHHSNLDVSSLTLRQQLYLALIYYLTWRNILRGVVVLGVFTWFMFNAYMVFKDFLAPDSVTYMEYQKPSWTMPPSVSVCIVWKSLFNNSKPISRKLLFSEDHQNGPANKTFQFKVNDPDDELSLPNLSQLVKMCTFTPNGFASNNEQKKDKLEKECSSAVPVLVTTYERKKCYTYFSDIYGEFNRKSEAFKKMFQMDFQRSPFIRLHFNGYFLNSDNTEFVLDYVQEGVFVTIHDHNVPPSMLEHSQHRVRPNKQIDIKFSKKVEEWNTADVGRLWSTRKCYAYNKFASVSKQSSFTRLRPNDTTVPPSEFFQLQDLSTFRSRGECFLQCLWAKSFSESNVQMNCFNYYILLTMVDLDEYYRKYDKKDRRKMCAESEKQYQAYNQMKNECQNLCLKDCTEHTFYTESVQEVSNLTGIVKKDEAIIDIEWNTGMDIYIRHKDKMRLPNFLGTLGGHAHVLLGVSVISLLSLLTKLFRSGSDMLRVETAHGCCHFAFLWCRACKHRGGNVR